MLRRIYRFLVNYKSGYAVFRIPKNPNPHEVAGGERVAILDLDSFLSFFGTPQLLANHLQAKALELMTEWRSINKTALPNFRRPICHYEEIARYNWCNARNKPETSVYELTISSWGHTKAINSSSDPPRIQLGDLKVSE